MVERRDLAAERMVPAAKCTGLFQRKNVGRLFCNAEDFSVARWVGADFADFVGSKQSAQITGMNRLTRIGDGPRNLLRDRKSTRLNSSHLGISYAVFCLKKKIKK